MTFRKLRYAMLLPALVLAGCPTNQAPVADAGKDQTVNEGTAVILKGKGKDKDGKIALYSWAQTGGPQVEFATSKDGSVLEFAAPETDQQLTLTFELTVYDNLAGKSAPDSVTVTVDQIKFFGTAPGGPEDYEHLLEHFDQLTPENAGKWGSVEGTRDVMNWTDLDIAYAFARDNGLVFKFHTLIWGQQQPGWIDALPAEEQLAEIQEWMAEVAARYPDLELIEVVNEPMNAPPAYREALGGAGETGFDWIITAFEMAREHFPNAKLAINEYNVMIENGLTTNYLNIINLLIERDLIDGIGEQAHFYERASTEVIAANLDRLAATGLPIYISEFDLNLANDADHANVMSRLFPVFWDHPSVGGVTHWGHIQGSVWRPNAYLVRSDDTSRPALDWLDCYIAGEADTCPVPEYVHPGWQGGEFGLTLTAVNHDEGQGVVSGGTIAYTDDGDWIVFKGVELQAGWDTVWTNYAKGNTEPGSISIHLDSLANAPVATIELPPTAGWGSAATVEQPWTPIEGTHDVYIRFNGGPGVGNLNSVRIGKPIPQSDINLLPDGGFETGIDGWQSWNGSTLSASTEQQHGGNQSLKATGRPNTAQFAVYNLTSVIQPDTTYAVSAWVYHTGAAADTVRLAAKVECTPATTPSGHNAFPWLNNNTAVAPNTWTQLSANLTIPDCDVMDVAIFFEGTSVGSDVYVDDVRVVPPTNNLVSNGTFEADASGWSSWNGATLTATDTQAHSGNQSLLATDRPNTNQFAVYSLTGSVQPNTTYSVSAWAQITGTDPGTVRLAAKVECTADTVPDGHNTYPWLNNMTGVVPGAWTQITANLVIPDCTINDVAIFFEGTAVGVDVYLDDVSVTAQ